MINDPKILPKFLEKAKEKMKKEEMKVSQPFLEVEKKLKEIEDKKQ